MYANQEVNGAIYASRLTLLDCFGPFLVVALMAGIGLGVLVFITVAAILAMYVEGYSLQEIWNELKPPLPQSPDPTIVRENARLVEEANRLREEINELHRDVENAQVQ